MKNKLTLTKVVAQAKKNGLEGFDSDTIANELELKDFHTLVAGQFAGNGIIVGPDGQALDLALMLTEQQQQEVEASDNELLGVGKGGAGNGKVSSATLANKAVMGMLRIDEVEDEMKARGWVETFTPKACDRDNWDDGGWSSIPAEFVSIANVVRGIYDKKLERYDVRNNKALGQVESTSDVGGFFLSERTNNEFLMSAERLQPYMAMRRTFKMSGKSMVFPVLADEDRSTDEVAGLALARVAEGATITEDTIQIKQARLSLNKAARIVKVSNELMSDSVIAMGPVLTDVFGKCVSLLQGKDFFEGTGGGQPLGFLNANDLHTTDKVDGQSASTILYENVLEMAMRIDPGGGDGTVWLAHPNTLKDLALMVVIVGTGGHAIWAAESINTLPRTLLGYNLHFTEHAKTLGVKGDINLVNMGAYFYATQGEGLIVEASPHANWTSDEISFRAKIRDDGLPWRSGKKTDRQNWETANFVTLETRA